MLGALPLLDKCRASGEPNFINLFTTAIEACGRCFLRDDVERLAQQVERLALPLTDKYRDTLQRARAGNFRRRRRSQQQSMVESNDSLSFR